MAQEKYYKAKDLTGGDFGEDRKLTVEGWREQAREWADMDDDYETYEYLELLSTDKILPYIAYYWELEFVEVTDD